MDRLNDRQNDGRKDDGWTNGQRQNDGTIDITTDGQNGQSKTE